MAAVTSFEPDGGGLVVAGLFNPSVPNPLTSFVWGVGWQIGEGVGFKGIHAGSEFLNWKGTAIRET